MAHDTDTVQATDSNITDASATSSGESDSRNTSDTSAGATGATTDSAAIAATAASAMTPGDSASPASEAGGATGTEGDLRAFAELGLGEAALRAIADLGYVEPTPIQQETIASLLQGRDVIAQAPTGTGKTAAYGLPIVERLDEDEMRPQALVLAPTRELAIQVAEALHALGKYREMVTLPIYGGQPYERQFRALARGVQVVVGTPGRLLDHLNRGTLDLSHVHTVVLDEADEMLDMGFIEDIETILAQLPEQRQSALFSATIPPRIGRLAEQYLHDPVRVSVATREAVAPRVRQVYYETAETAKSEALARILDLEQPESAIVFVRMRRDADTLAEQLNGMGYIAQPIHGDLNQAQRERALDRFRAGRTQLLVATDVAARGLDIPDVSHVINYDLPVDAESYVHRIGRTGRAGRGGEALTLVTPRERRQLRYIEQAIHRRLERLRLPTPADIAARRRAAFREDVLSILDAGQLDPFLALVEDLAGAHDAAQLAAAAFKMAAQAREANRPGSGQALWAQWNQAEAPAESEAQESEPDERPDRGPRGERPARGRRDRDRRFERDAERAEPGMARLFLRVGRLDNVRPTDIVGAIANEAGLPGETIGDIDIYDAFSFVEVPEQEVEVVREALNHTTIRGKRAHATLARPADRLFDGEADDRGSRSDRSERRGGWGQRDSRDDDGDGRGRKPVTARARGRETPSTRSAIRASASGTWRRPSAAGRKTTAPGRKPRS